MIAVCHRAWRGRLLVGGAVWLALVACSACATARQSSLGVACELSSECDTPLVCRLGFCRNECGTSADCDLGLSCVLDPNGLGACQLMVESSCIETSECPSGLVCRFRQCTNACESDRDCASGLRCEMDDEGLACRDTSSPCTYDEECAPARTAERCLRGRCRRECFTDRDCRNDFWCNAGACRAPPHPDAGPIDVGAGDVGEVGPIDVGADDGGVPASDCRGGGPLGDVVTFDHNDRLGCAVVGGASPGVYCWGRGTEAVFGRTPTLGLSPQHCAGRVASVPPGPWDEIVVLGSTAACVRMGNVVFCWGNDAASELPDAVRDLSSETPVSVMTGSLAFGLFRSEGTAGFTQTTSGLYVWGTGENGRLGDGSTGTVRYDLPTPLPAFGFSVTTLASSNEATCTNGPADVVCRPAMFSGLGAPLRAQFLTAGDLHFCATDLLTVRCWGANGHGQLGRGDAIASTARELVMGLPAMDILAIDAGGRSSCALMADRSMWCWGAPQPIDPRRGTLDFVLAPIRVMENRRLIRVDEDVACGLGVDRQILCVGLTSLALGYGTGPAPVVPVPVQR